MEKINLAGMVETTAPLFFKMIFSPVLNRLYKIRMIVPAFWLMFMVSPMPLGAQDVDSSLWPGEKLTFEIRWGLIPAGTAQLEILPFENYNGVAAWHFVMTAATNSFVDHVYKVRDRIDAYADREMTRSLFYKKKQREGHSKKNIEVTFDWLKMQAQYSNFGKKRAPISIEPGTFDPLSAFYFTRLFDWEHEKEIRRPVTDGKKNILGKARRVKRETIQTPAGTFDAYLYEPDIEHIGGVFEKSPDAKIKLWVTADQRRIPVRLESKVIVGSFVAELISKAPVNPPEKASKTVLHPSGGNEKESR
jgi:hypothetical protein